MRLFEMHANTEELITSALALQIARISRSAFGMMVKICRKIHCEKAGSATLG
jgi:hypothetical protein